MDDSTQDGSFLWSSQNVTYGDPDKLCDFISDSILDACLTEDPNAKVACECVLKDQVCMVFGQISTTANVNFETIVRKAIKQVGYDSPQKGMDYTKEVIIVSIDKQNIDIAKSVHLGKSQLEMGAGDQGLMIGYATDQNNELMPCSQNFCNLIVIKLEKIRKENQYAWIGPYAKVQVTVRYQKNKEAITPINIERIVIQCQTHKETSFEAVKNILKNQVIREVIPSSWLKNSDIIINPHGVIHHPPHMIGGTGRKIIYDTYGGWGGHGGGAFSGKDCSKVDRSAGYATRWIAKSLVANNFCKRVAVQISYSIGIPQPFSIFIDSFQTAVQGYSDEDLTSIVLRNFDLRPGVLINLLCLKRPIFKQTSHGGHFGRNQALFTWQDPKNLSHQKKKTIFNSKKSQNQIQSQITQTRKFKI